MAHYLTLYQRDNLSDNVIDIERYLLDVSLVRERPDAPDPLTCPIGFRADPFHSAARFVQVGSCPVKPAQAGRRGIDDGSERLIHFMGDRGSQLAQGCYPPDMGQVRLRVAQCSLDVLALR